jgi:hypothetical protein
MADFYETARQLSRCELTGTSVARLFFSVEDTQKYLKDSKFRTRLNACMKDGKTEIFMSLPSEHHKVSKWKLLVKSNAWKFLKGLKFNRFDEISDLSILKDCPTGELEELEICLSSDVANLDAIVTYQPHLKTLTLSSSGEIADLSG